ncbi:MAG: hypothetical protein K8T20_02000 [Planctomycetes bacterium]|nr:hypothetical protein [Planctomycetota bacterium]
MAVCLFIAPGCAYMQDRGKDFTEIWRGGAGFGLGALAEVRVGDVLHLGAGGVAAGAEFGASYGSPMMEMDTEVIFGPFHAASWIWHGTYGPWASRQCWQTPPCQHCLGVLPVLTNHSVRTWMHRFDLEVRVTALVSIDVGFSPGEFVDFIVGWFGVELDPLKQDPPKGWTTGIPGPFEPPPREEWPDEQDQEPEKK